MSSACLNKKSVAAKCMNKLLVLMLMPCLGEIKMQWSHVGLLKSLRDSATDPGAPAVVLSSANVADLKVTCVCII